MMVGLLVYCEYVHLRSVLVKTLQFDLVILILMEVSTLIKYLCICYLYWEFCLFNY